MNIIAMPPSAARRAVPLRHGRVAGVRLGMALACSATMPFAAHAATPTVLPDALGVESFSLNYQKWTQTAYGIGTLDYGLNPGCAAAGADCHASTTLNGPGGGPAVEVVIDQAAGPQMGNGQENHAKLYYYVTYSGPDGATAGNYYPVTINMSDTLHPGGGQAQAYFGFGIAQTDPNASAVLRTGQLQNDVVNAGADGTMLSVTESLTDCASGPGYGNEKGCMVGAGNYLQPHPLTTHKVMMQAGALYLVDIWVAVSPADTAASAYLDPTFSAVSGTFTFSAGVSNAVPEPEALLMFVPGVALLLGARQRRMARLSRE